VTTTITDDEKAGRAEQLRFRFDILTDDDLALSLGLTTQTLATWRSNGEGPAYVKAGKTVFYRREDVESWLELCVTHPRARQAPANDNEPSDRSDAA